MPVFYNPDRSTRSSKRIKRSPSNMTRMSPEDDGGDANSGERLLSGALDIYPEDSQRSQDPSRQEKEQNRQTSDRAELIESIKRGESPTWVPKPGLEALLAEQNGLTRGQPANNPQPSPAKSQVLPASGITSYTHNPNASQVFTTLITPDEIVRPGSALHSGDFRERSADETAAFTATSFSRRMIGAPSPPVEAFLTTSWPSSPPPVPSFPRVGSGSHAITTDNPKYTSRMRAPSLGSSLSSSFIKRTPTSPLVHSASNTDLEVTPWDAAEKGSRRRTLPPEIFRSLRHSLDPQGGHHPPNFSRPLPKHHYQAHQPRRSLTSFTYQPASSLQSPPFPRSRRPSFPDVSPIQHASMVGSFEESILRGRMSTAPSKPLDFVAQIGVLGKGDCKPSLRCPAHVTVPFPAVFYNYPTIVGSKSFADDNPSPYVGIVDLEQSLKPPEPRKARRRHASLHPSPDAAMRDLTAPENTPIGREIERKKRERRRRSPSPKPSLGGCYRVPQQGQLQIVIKNPNKTAVKLYLVPYDLNGMASGTKTFVRQRSFSSGPFLEKPLSDKPQPIPLEDPLKDKHILRYLIHLKFCCPSKDCYYLYDNIRVVFANRVPDGKEKLRNEIQLPEPRFTPYRPGRDFFVGSAGAKLVAENAYERQGSRAGMVSPDHDVVDGIISRGPPPASVNSPIPFHMAPTSRRIFAENEPSRTFQHVHASQGAHEPFPSFDVISAEPALVREQVVSPTCGFVASTSTRSSPIPLGSRAGSPSERSFSPAPPEEGLLARKLRSLDVQKCKDSYD